MKEYKFILLGFLAIVTVSLFIILKDISSLNAKNNTIAFDIKGLMQRIVALEQNKTIEQMIALRAENASLKNELKVLLSELNTAAQSTVPPSPDPGQEAKGTIEQEPAVPGSKGFLKREN
ncbi:MAG: hypothetical protein A3K83_04235 [Omnitrophica WOR_2 bacterium RBG_13_44_8b]|nr:MAG: hypothetical protein A3K83_04235 [Omnitrophica WOR_2 bacterium RBG_13_44_8b]